MKNLGKILIVLGLLGGLSIAGVYVYKKVKYGNLKQERKIILTRRTDV